MLYVVLPSVDVHGFDPLPEIVTMTQTRTRSTHTHTHTHIYIYVCVLGAPQLQGPGATGPQNSCYKMKDRSRFRVEELYFFSSRDLPSLLSNGYRYVRPWKQRDQGVKPTTHLHQLHTGQEMNEHGRCGLKPAGSFPTLEHFTPSPSLASVTN